MTSRCEEASRELCAQHAAQGETMEEKGRKKKRIDWVYIGVAAFFLTPLVLLVLLTTFLQSTAFVVGSAGVVQAVLIRLVMAALALGGILFCLHRLRRPEASWKTVLGCTAAILACAALGFVMVRDVVLDLPMLDRPAVTYLERLRFDIDASDESAHAYSMEGVDIEGERQVFSVTRKLYREGYERWLENNELRAKVTYLPHMKVLLELEWLTGLDTQVDELYPPRPELPDDWQSFSVQINGMVYTLPMPLSTFLESGWQMEEDAAGLVLESAEGPDTYYGKESLTLTSESGQQLLVEVYNTTAAPLTVEEGTVGALRASCSNYEFSGADLILPGGLRLGWSTREDVRARYGEPDGNELDLLYTYGAADAPGYAVYSFDDEGYLTDVSLYNQDSRPGA